MRYAIRPGIALILVVAGAAVSLAQLKVQVRRGPVPLPPLPTTPPAAAKGGIHIAPGRTTSPMWTVTDSHGYRWDISGNGMVSDGTNDAYDGGMQLQINGTAFPSQPTARLSADGREIEIGWRYNNLSISRRIFVNTKAGYCRWIDIFENTTGAEVTASLRYYFNMGEGTGKTYATSGGAGITEKDWGVVTSGSSSSSSHPAVVHIFAAPRAKFKPLFQFTRGDDNLYYHVTIKVPAGKVVALCFFEAQRRPYAQAVGFLKEFDPARELRLVPTPLRRLLLNMGAGVLTLGGVELKRSEEADLLILRNGNEIYGKVAAENYVLRTDFGQVKVPAGKVIGLLGRSAESNQVHVVMAGGQVIAGELTSGPIVVELAGGTVLRIPLKGLLQTAYRISPERPEEIAITDSLTVFRSGARLAFDEASAAFEFLTPHGILSLSAGDLRYIEMDIPDGGLHRTVFRNGSTLAGLLTAESIRLKLKLGPAMEVPRQRLKRFVFAARPVESKGLAKLTFRNADVISGRFTDEKWTVRSKFASVAVAPSDVVEAEFNAAALGEVKLTLRDGTKLDGKLADNYIGFKIVPGPALKIFVGHINSITGRAAAKATSKSAANIPTASRIRCPKCGGYFLPKHITDPEAFRNAEIKVVCPRCGADLSEWYKKHRSTTRTGRITIAEGMLGAGEKAKIDELKMVLAKIRAERVQVEARLKDIRIIQANNANNPKAGARLQPTLMKLEAMLAKLRAREDKVKKMLAEASLRNSSGG